MTLKTKTNTDVKKQILQFIINNPSSHLRKIKDSLGYSMGTIQYHIKNLEKDGSVISIKKFYRNYYCVENFEQTELMSTLNLQTPRKIIIHLLQHDSANQSELAKATGLTSPTISFHMKKLLSLGIIDLRYDGKFSIYSIKDKESIIPIIRLYSTHTLQL